MDDDKIEYTIESEDEEDLKDLSKVAESAPKPDKNDGLEDGQDESDEDSESADDESEDPTGENQDGSDELEAKRQARREERRLRKERARQREREREEELRQLRATVERLTNNQGQTQAMIIQSRIRDRLEVLKATHQGAKQALSEAEERLALAAQNNDGSALAQALRDRDASLEAIRSSELEYRDIVRRVEQARNQHTDQPREEQPRISPKAVQNFARWAADKPWFDIHSGDNDSKVVLAIDQQIANEGFNPETEEYWRELDSRVKSALKHKFKNMSKPSGSPPVRGSGSSSSAPKFQLSAERVRALKDAGIWDDPVKRDRMIKKYQEYDAKNKENA